MMRALKHGVPMVVIPGFPHDQAPNAALVEELGAGLALPGDADAAVLQQAADQILNDQSFKNRAQELARIVQPLDGASNAAHALDQAVSEPEHVA
jgi:UDP:flavonoid glycosyltransferase YjiC (YdhE family)